MNPTIVTLASTLLLTAFAAAGCSHAKADPPLACNLAALSAPERERHAALLAELGTMTREMRETKDGYALRLHADAPGFQRVAEWITLERRCCPFLRFDLRWNAGEEEPWLELGGRAGVKELLAAEMGAATPGKAPPP